LPKTATNIKTRNSLKGSDNLCNENLLNDNLLSIIVPKI